MLRACRTAMVALAALTICLLPLTPTQASPAGQEPAGGFERLLGFVQAPTTVDELAGVWINYADPGTVKRMHGYDFTSHQGRPPLIAADATDLTPEQRRAQRWLWDQRTMDFPVAAGYRLFDRWADVFGYDGFAVERSLEYGQPVKDFGVLELAIDTGGIADKLAGLGYASGAAPHGFAGTLFQRLGDYDQDLASDAGRIALSSMNRIVLGPRLLVAARATEVISQPLAASTGQAPNTMSVPPIALVARSLEDPALLPGTTLVSASVLGLEFAPSGRAIQQVIRGHSPEEAFTEQGTRPPLPPYLLYGIGYRRSADQVERYEIFTLYYPDEDVAREAGAALTARIATFRSVSDGKPLLGDEVVEQLEPVVRTDAGGATVTVRLRLAPDHPNNAYFRLVNRDLDFLAPGT